MAGEWIAIDLALPEKPEFQEIMELTGLDEPYVLWWLRKMWGWASMHCADGTARMTMSRMVRVWGADEAFWQAVAAVGWLEIDETAATVAVPGWDRRFSQAAKARLQHRDRAAAQEDGRGRLRDRAGTACAQAQGEPAQRRRRGDERRSEVPPPPREAALGEAWQRLRAAWNDGATPQARRRPWKPATAPDGAEAVLGAAGWLDEALEAIPRLAECRYFGTPVTLIQFTRPGFVQKVLGQAYDDKTPSRGPRTDGDHDRPPPRVDPAFEAARKATEAREAARREAEHRRLDEKADRRGDDVSSAKASVVRSLRRATAGGAA